MLLRSISKCLLSRSNKANLLSQIPQKSSLISRSVVRSGLFFNHSTNNKSPSAIISTRSIHSSTAIFAKRTDIDRSEREDGEYVKPVDFGKPTQRVAKIIASYGQCTKAQAEVLIEQGRVKVNGEVVKEIPTKVPLDSKIYVDDTLLKKPRPRVFIHYKKKMFLAKLSFEEDPKGRRNLFAVLQAMGVPSVVPIDTLDYSSEGIMLLTNDSMYKALLAKTARENWQCLYKLKVLGEVTEKFIAKSQEKLTHQGEKLPGINIKIDETPGERESSYTWLSVLAPASVSHVALKDHFKRHNILVSRLMRLTYGPYSLDTINAGDVHEVPIKVIEKNIIKEGEELPTIENLTETEPKKRKLTRSETKLKNKGLLDLTKRRTQKTDKGEEEDDMVEEDVMEDEDVEDDIDDDEVEEVKPRKTLATKRDNYRQQGTPSKRPSTFDKNKPMKDRYQSSKPWEKNNTKYTPRRRDDDADNDNEDEGAMEKRAPRSSYKPRGQFDNDKKPFKRDFDGDKKPFKREFDSDRKPFKREFDSDKKPFKRDFDGNKKPFKREFDSDKRPFKGGRQEYSKNKFSGGPKKRTAQREDDD